MQDKGWIKLHRKLLDDPIMQKPDILQLFVYCLLKANHEDNTIIFNGKEMVVKRGQFVTGRQAIANFLKQKPITTYKRLLTLQNLEILNIESNNKFSLITITNYELYQFDDKKSNKKRNNKGTTKEQQNNTNKNDKNDKNEKKDIYITCRHLSMTKEEYEKLTSVYGKERVDDKIESARNYKGWIS